jgi:hypothetical protein
VTQRQRLVAALTAAPESAFPSAPVMPQDSQATLRTRTHMVRAAATQSLQYGKDAAGDFEVLVHGRLCGSITSAADVALSMSKNGPAATARSLNGSFVILVLDQRSDCIYVVTDRLNSLRVFFSGRGSDALLSTELFVPPWSDGRLDAGAIGWYLASGAVFAGRSLYADTTVLERATLHEYRQGRLDGQRYWTYTLTPGSRSQSALITDYRDLLAEAVRRQLPQAGPVHQSLSGGYDSAALLGILSRILRQHDVHCFSYAQSVPAPGTDAFVASRTASALGVPFRTLRSYRGDVRACITANVAYGSGFCQFCDEIDAWQQLRAEISAGSSAMIAVTDNFYPNRPESTRTDRRGPLHSNRIVSIHEIPWLSALLPTAASSAMRDAAEQDTDRILSNISTNEHSGDRDLATYLDQRLVNVVLPWRQYIAGSCGTVCNPFHDYELLDFFARIPRALRDNKPLYIRTVKQMFPEIFALPRATANGYVLDLASEATRAAREMSVGSLPPGSLGSLLGDNFENQLRQACLETNHSYRLGLVRRLRPWVSAMVPRRIKRLRQPPYAVPSPGTVLARYWILADALVQKRPHELAATVVPSGSHA